MAVDKRGAAADATEQQRAVLRFIVASQGETGDRERVYLLDCWANGARVH